MSRPNKKQRPELQNPFPAHGGVVDDNAVLDVFVSLELNKTYIPHKLPVSIYSRLNSLLPKHGLQPFMRRHPDIFGIEEGDEPEKWKFKLLAPPIAQPADGGHAQAAIVPSAAFVSGLMATPPGLGNNVSAAPQHPPLVPPLYSQQNNQWQPMALGPSSVKYSRAVVSQWSVAHVVEFLQTLALGHMSDQAMFQALDGPLLLALIDGGSLEEMFTKIQARKIMGHIE